MNAEVTAEIDRVHQLLARWLGTDGDPAVLAALRASHADDFTMITSGGEVLDVDQLFASLGGARNAVPGLAIEIDEVETIADTPGVVVVGFRETHHAAGEPSRRRTTAVLRRSATGLRWRHVHETAQD